MSAYPQNFGENGLDTFSDGNDHVLSSNPVPTDCVGTISFTVNARRVSDGAAKVFEALIGFKRDDGAVQIFGQLSASSNGTVGDLLALTGVTVAFQVNGDAIEVVVNGNSGQEIDWQTQAVAKGVQHIED